MAAPFPKPWPDGGAGARAAGKWRLGSAEAETKLTFSHHVPTTHILHATAERYARAVHDKTNGQVVVEIRPASQLFNLRTSA